jgi:hypothetical protein
MHSKHQYRHSIAYSVYMYNQWGRGKLWDCSSTHLELFLVLQGRPLVRVICQTPMHNITYYCQRLVQQLAVELQGGVADGLGHIQEGCVARVPDLHSLGDFEEVFTQMSAFLPAYLYRAVQQEVADYLHVVAGMLHCTNRLALYACSYSTKDTSSTIHDNT